MGTANHDVITAPKVFITYSWSGKEHQERVLAFATELVHEHGVDVVIDEWNLKPGNDKYKFMESCVSDTSITHVLIICDSKYANKADAREGGVGTETAIITPEIYSKSEQTRFVPVVFEYDYDGKPCLPIFLKSRIYFDLANYHKNYDTEYEKLIRHLWGKPLIEKPPLGKMPEWLNGKESNLSKLRRLIKEYESNMSNHRRKEEGIVNEYIDIIKGLRKDESISGAEIYDAIMGSKPLQDLFAEFVSIKITSGQETIGKDIADYLEKINNVLRTKKPEDTYYEDSNEISIFLIHELLIRIAAIMSYYGNYAALGQLVNHTYFLVRYQHSSAVETGIEALYGCGHIAKFETEYKERRKDKGKLFSIQADLYIERTVAPYASKEQLVIGDMFLFQLSHTFSRNEQDWYWYPITYIYGIAEYMAVWRKCISLSFCVRIFPAFGCCNLGELKALLRQRPAKSSGYQVSIDSPGGILQVIREEQMGTLP